jgi:hypothetical protein
MGEESAEACGRRDQFTRTDGVGIARLRIDLIHDESLDQISVSFEHSQHSRFGQGQSLGTLKHNFVGNL